MSTSEQPAPGRVRVPAVPEPRPRASFPLLAALAPVVAAVVIWAVTRSPYVLAFAAIGPVAAAAGYADGLRLRSREARRDRAAYEAARARAQRRIEEDHRAECAAMLRAVPLAAQILAAETSSDSRWRATPASMRLVLGRGRGPSALQVDGAPEDPLAIQARELRDAPLQIALGDGIGVHGEASLVRAYVRGLLVQVAHGLPPGAIGIDAPSGGCWEWARLLPHAAGAVTVRIEDGFGAAARASGGDGPLIALAATAGELPPRCRCVVHVEDARTASIVGRRGRGVAERARVELVSLGDAAAYASGLAALAPPVAGEGLPARVPLRGLLPAARSGGESGLPAVLGVGADGPVTVDLVADGPHAIVGGTTGSGKSEFLTAWVLAMAARHSPGAVTFLLADFKGGATFSALATLPHCVGSITDLAPAEAQRAFESLTAELRRRERRLAELGAKDVAAAMPHGLARLVVIVDECAFLLEQAPELHWLFADIAARGRSLGVHLVLCTQRPAGVVRDAVAANCGLRISLRVNDDTDSRLVVATDAAARLPHDAPGRLVLARGSGTAVIQAAIAGPGDADAVRQPGDERIPVHRPWLDPLPPVLPLPAHHRSAVARMADAALGLVDRPAAQRQDAVTLGEGGLLVVGARASGRTAVLEMLASQAPPGLLVCTATTAEAAWDAVIEAAAAIGGGRASALPVIVVDDLDLLVRRFPPDQQRTFVEALATVLRAASSTGCTVIASTQRLGDGLTALQPLFGRTLVLRMASRQEHQLLGTDAPHDPALPPGGGWWHGERIQVFAPPAGIELEERARLCAPAAATIASIPFGRAPVVVVAGAPAAARARLAVLGVTACPVPGPGGAASADSVPVGAVEEWHVARTLFDRARTGGVVLFDSVSSSEVRALLGPRVLVPYCSSPTAVLRWCGGRLDRLGDPPPPPAATDSVASGPSRH